MDNKHSKNFGKIRYVKAQDLVNPKSGQIFDMSKIMKLSHDIARIEHEKRDCVKK